MNNDEKKYDVAGDFDKNDDQSSMNRRVAGEIKRVAGTEYSYLRSLYSFLLLREQETVLMLLSTPLL